VFPPGVPPPDCCTPPSVTPTPPPAKPSASIALDPNTATVENLERLPGLTRYQAEAIVRGRPYRTLADLVTRKALSQSELQALAPYLSIR